MQSVLKQRVNSQFHKCIKTTESQPTTQQSRTRKKYLKVYSKRNINQSQHQDNTSVTSLNHSRGSPPIQYNAQKKRTQSQPKMNSCNNDCGTSKNTYQIGHRHARSHSLTTKPAIIQKAVQPLPINISQIKPHNVYLNQHENYEYGKVVTSTVMSTKMSGREKMRKLPIPYPNYNSFALKNIENMLPNHHQESNKNCISFEKSQQEKGNASQNYISAHPNKIPLHQQNIIPRPLPSNARITSQRFSLFSNGTKKTVKLLSNQSYLQCQIKLSNPKNKLKHQNQREQKNSSLMETHQNLLDRNKQSESKKNEKYVVELHISSTKLQNLEECIEIKINSKHGSKKPAVKL